jgi:hypothetical protein
VHDLLLEHTPNTRSDALLPDFCRNLAVSLDRSARRHFHSTRRQRLVEQDTQKPQIKMSTRNVNPDAVYEPKLGAGADQAPETIMDVSEAPTQKIKKTRRTTRRVNICFFAYGRRGFKARARVEGRRVAHRPSLRGFILCGRRAWRPKFGSPAAPAQNHLARLCKSCFFLWEKRLPTAAQSESRGNY